MEIRLLSDHRKDLVAERTRVQNRLRWHLLELCPELERSLKRGSLAAARQLERIDRRLRRIGGGARVRVARDQVTQLRVLSRQIDALERELLVLVQAHRPHLLAETGCGALTTALLIGRTAGTAQFRSDASFARQTGTAPIPCSSGQRHRHRLDRGGDRQLNHALHVIAITRARHDPDTKAYLARKEAEGKTKQGALRCLKRHLARRFYHLLALPAEPPERDRGNLVDVLSPEPRRNDPGIAAAAPTPMPCLR
jgi:transposase